VSPDLTRQLRSRSARRTVASVRRIVTYVLAGLLILAVLGAVFFLSVRLPQWLVSIASIKDVKERVSLENEILKTLVQILGGALFLLGVYFTWRNLRLAQEGQITQRFNDAIEHLGSDKPEVKLGGIYALARIARDSPKDHISVMHVFSSYVRETTQRTKSEPVAAEVQAILTMMARRTLEHESDDDEIDLRDAFIPGVNLRDAQFERVRLDGATLSRAQMESALLRGATLRGALLDDAYLRFADLRDSDLTGADLRQSSLRGALLDGADIFGAQLEGATLLRTDLSGVKNAMKPQIAAALTDETTIPPVYGELVYSTPAVDD
jgi:Pentapeptide repeats (8 copies)